MSININITQDQMSLIYDALESYYYICREGSNKERVENILLLETLLYKQKVRQVYPENKKRRMMLND